MTKAEITPRKASLAIHQRAINGEAEPHRDIEVGFILHLPIIRNGAEKIWKRYVGVAGVLLQAGPVAFAFNTHHEHASLVEQPTWPPPTAPMALKLKSSPLENETLSKP